MQWKGRGVTSLNGGLNEDELRMLLRLKHVLAQFKEIRPTMPVSQAMALLEVALQEGAPVSELAESAKAPVSIMSRYLLDLGPVQRDKSPGHGLVEARLHPTNLRAHAMYLTPKGRGLIKRVARTLIEGSV
jgi:DNA-binding MarR family transcriptional regulator